MRNAPAARGEQPLLGQRERGLSLVELMVAMTLGLVLVSGVGYVYLGSAQAYRTQDAMSRLQESARYAFELIGKDLRMGGTTGCSYSAGQKVLNTTSWYGGLLDQPLFSVEKDGTAGTETQYSDALRIVRADTSSEYIVQNHDAGTAQFTLTAASDLATGQLMVATDCSNVALFQAASASGTTVSHATAAVPGNITANLGPSGAAYPYPAGSRLYRLQAVTYFVKLNPAGVPALYRRYPTTPNATLIDEELIEGVEDFQVAYGIDTTTPDADGEPDFIDPDADGDPYLTAAQITAANVPGSTTSERWGRAVSVRVSLLMRSVQNNVASQSQTYRYNGANVTPNDRYIRKVFTHVIKLRNR